MTNQTLDTYYTRMSSSLGDKRKVLNYLKGDSVLDVGCGSGDLLTLLYETGMDAWGVDPAQESVDRNKYPERVKAIYADEVDYEFESNKFDTIICSSVFHEVFSYGRRYGRHAGTLEALKTTLRSLHSVLKPGGRLIVRDGVRPDLRGTYSMTVDDPKAVDKFLSESPFSVWNTSSTYNHGIDIWPDGHGIYRGSASSLMEFAFTYTWGPNSFTREVQEFYGLMPLDAYSTYVEHFGFTNIEKFSYIQAGYIEHLSDKVAFDFPFPATNAIWVYEKK